MKKNYAFKTRNNFNFCLTVSGERIAGYNLEGILQRAKSE